MSLTNSDAWTTLDAVKGELCISDDSQDGRLSRYIRAVSELLEGELNFKVRREAVVDEPQPGRGFNPYMQLCRAPLDPNETITVKFFDEDIGLGGFEIYSAETSVLYLLSGENFTGQLIRGPVYDAAAWTDRKQYKVSYTAGWTLPNDDTGLARDFPYSLEQVAVEAVVSMFRQAGRDVTVKSESLGPWSVVYGGNDGLKSAHDAILAKYARIVQA